MHTNLTRFLLIPPHFHRLSSCPWLPLLFAFSSPRWGASRSPGTYCVSCHCHAILTGKNTRYNGEALPAGSMRSNQPVASLKTLASTFHKTHVSNSHSPAGRVGILSLHSDPPVSPTRELHCHHAVGYAARTGEPHTSPRPPFPSGWSMNSGTPHVADNTQATTTHKVQNRQEQL